MIEELTKEKARYEQAYTIDENTSDDWYGVKCMTCGNYFGIRLVGMILYADIECMCQHCHDLEKE